MTKRRMLIFLLTALFVVLCADHVLVRMTVYQYQHGVYLIMWTNPRPDGKVKIRVLTPMGDAHATYYQQICRRGTSA